MVSLPAPYQFESAVPRSSAFNPTGVQSWTNQGLTPSAGAPGPLTVRTSNSHYGTGYQDVNGVVNRHYFLDKSRWRESHTCPEMLTFSKAKRPEGRQTNLAAFEMKSISSLNYHLKYDAQFLHDFNQPTAHQLMSTWLPMGFQHDREQSANGPGDADPKLVYHYAKRATAPNLWLAHRLSARPQQEMDECWLLARRYPIEYDSDLQVNAHLSSLRQGLNKKIVEHYWQFEVYVGLDRVAPAWELFSCPHEVTTDPVTKEIKRKPGWVGARLHVGVTHSVYLPQDSRTAKTVDMARKALHPTADSTEYQALYFKLPRQVMQQI